MTTFIRITIIIWTLAFFGGLITGKSVFATPEGSGILGTEEYDNKKRLGDSPVWYQKPIQCMSTKAVLQNTKKTGMEVFWGGRGKSNTTEQPVALNVFVFLAMNIKTKDWVIFEASADGKESCVIGFGDDVDFDPKSLNNLLSPFKYDK
jgi:hypothetical protein|tara:strand:- start:560 stop:1006 length:447 start_codon:yes stop_codon:yes gene_type:complete